MSAICTLDGRAGLPDAAGAGGGGKGRGIKSQAQQGALSRTGTMEWAEPNGNDCIMPEHGVTFCAGRVSRAEGGQFSAPAAPGSG
jgi:hypothetical protein